MPDSLSALLPKLPPAMLALGILLGLCGVWPAAWGALCKKASKGAIQASIVLLGFWVSLQQVAEAGMAGLAFSTGAIVLVLAVSWTLGRMLRTDRDTGTLLSAGTAICGGSAIAATGSAINAAPGTVAAATAIVFILNAAGVYIYPVIGHALGMSDEQFGAWCAVGVHDVAGVVGAAGAFSKAALADAVVIKLTRVLWIVPVALLLRRLARHEHPEGGKAKSPFPWFIILFLAACGLRAILERSLGTETIAPLGDAARIAATLLLAFALLLIGSAISRATIAALGWRPLVHGTVLWIIVSGAALVAARTLL
ncbi:MAG TPA: putative sulfate exporter family transporter [Phycisphaerales bacterium]|nr:putative sulfate exporter family transporter [Phycisphaerales bacterium]